MLLKKIVEKNLEITKKIYADISDKQSFKYDICKLHIMITM